MLLCVLSRLESDKALKKDGQKTTQTPLSKGIAVLFTLTGSGRADERGRERSVVAPVAQECVPLVFIGRLHTAAVAAAPAAAACYGTRSNHK